MRAKLVKTLKDKYGDGKTAFYEYRGHEYMVHFCNNGYSGDDYISRVHKEEQKKIDEMIEHEDDVVVPEKASNEWEKGFEMFWEDVNS